MTTSACKRNILSGTASFCDPDRRYLLRTHSPDGQQPCIRGQQGYLASVMITFVKQLRLLAHAGCLKAGT